MLNFDLLCDEKAHGAIELCEDVDVRRQLCNSAHDAERVIEIEIDLVIGKERDRVVRCCMYQVCYSYHDHVFNKAPLSLCALSWRVALDDNSVAEHLEDE